jgi:hypothetical protein
MTAPPLPDALDDGEERWLCAFVAGGLRGGSAEQGTFVPDGARFRRED